MTPDEMENVWQYLRANKLAITVFDTHDEILDKPKFSSWSLYRPVLVGVFTQYQSVKGRLFT